jgi:hypothetical protein
MIAGISRRETAARSLYASMISRPLSAGWEKNVTQRNEPPGSGSGRAVCPAYEMCTARPASARQIVR